MPCAFSSKNALGKLGWPIDISTVSTNASPNFSFAQFPSRSENSGLVLISEVLRFLLKSLINASLPQLWYILAFMPIVMTMPQPSQTQQRFTEQTTAYHLDAAGPDPE